MTTLITGAAGFIGSHLLSALLDAGEPVVALDNLDGYYPREEKRRNLAQALAGRSAPFYESDLNDAGALDRLFTAHRIAAVAHLAGRGGVRASVTDPQAYVAANLSATISLCQAMRRHGARKLVFASTSSVYGATPAPWREEAPADRPLSPYAASKRAAELYLHTESHLHGQDVTALRFFTVYGPRQRPDMALARFAAAAHAGHPLTRYGDGEQRRDFTEVGDLVAGFLAALRAPQSAGRYAIYNLGSGAPRSVNELIAIVQAAAGSSVPVETAPEQPGDVPLTYADISAARRDLGFAPRMTLEAGVARYFAWLDGRAG
jgi:UDP-glucuronate 4-epimerase